MSKHQHNLSPTRFRDGAGFGLRVFPVQVQDKKPACAWARYQTEAPSDQDFVRWDQSDNNVGVVTGAASGIVVLDVDNEEAQLFVDELGLPPTALVRTARGRHYYFKAPPFEIRNTVNLAERKLDFRGDGGYVVGAGSRHPDGTMYHWEVSPNEVDFAPLPQQVLALLTDKKAKVKPGSTAKLPVADMGDAGCIGQFLEQELSKAVAELAATPEGARNIELFKMAARMARHVAAAKEDWEPFAVALAETARSIGLGEDEIGRTLDSGWDAGSPEPTAWVRTATDHVYLANQACFYHLQSGQHLKREGFDGHHDHQYFGKGTFAQFLLKKGYIRKVHDLSYEPLNPDRFIERDGLEYLNTFRPSDVVAIPGDASPFEEFLVGLVPEVAEREHLVKMIAFTVRNPGHKLRYALLFRSGVQGVGKSMLLDIWTNLLGLRNVKKTTSEEISSGFQSFLPETLLVVCEELNLGQGLKMYNSLKDMVTSDTVRVNEKYLKPRQWNVYASFVFLTNLDRPLLIESTDRRIFFIDTPAAKRAPGYYADFAAWWGANLGVIRNYLDGIDLAEFRPHEAPPMTAAKRALIDGSKSEVAQELRWAIDEKRGVFERDLVTLDEAVFQLGRKWSDRQVAKALKEVGAVNLGQLRFSDDRYSPWVIRHAHMWCSAPKSAREEEFKSRGGGYFPTLEEAGIEVVHLSTSNDPAALVRGFERLFGFSAQSD